MKYLFLLTKLILHPNNPVLQQ